MSSELDLAVARLAALPVPETHEQLIERVAKAMFLAEYPRDRWDRFKVGDYARNRYLAIAEAAVAEINPR